MNNQFHHRSLGALALGAAAMAGMHCAHAELLVYEPFDYPDAPLNGNGGALGTSGTWTTNDTGFAMGWWCHPEGEVTGQGDDAGRNPNGVDQLNLFDGLVDNLATAGGFVGAAGPEDKDPPVAFGTRSPTGNLDASINILPSVTATFQSGTTTWFSYVGCHADNRNQGSPTFMLCTDPTVNGTRGLTMQNSGSGIGGVGGPPRFNLFDVYPHYFSGGLHHQSPGGYQDGVLGDHNGIVTAFCSTGTCNGVLGSDATRSWVVRDSDGFMGVPNIVVGKIEWDADVGGFDVISVVTFLETDDLTEAAFDAIIADKPLLSSRNWPAAGTPDDTTNPSNKPDLDQSQFDIINISNLKFWVDEIRIATEFADVVPEPQTPPPTIRLAIAAATSPSTGYDLEWDSTSSLVYDLRSSTDLLGPKTSWDLVSGGIAATPPVNTINVDPADPDLFYVVVGRPPPPVAIFSEDFDTTTAGSLPGGWDTSANPGFTASVTNWEVGTPSVVGPVPPGVPLPSGTQCVGTDIDADYDDPVANDGFPFTDIWLRTPPIDLTGKSEGTLSFQQWTEIEDVAGDFDYGSIRILDAFDDSELVVIENRTIDGSTTGWEQYSAALPAAAFTAVNGTIRIEFRFEADDIDSFAGWYIDDVEVTVPAE
ncbi:MAG: hypothetical protein HKN82_08805 [Akkermansiaceae bacterium]|nr:hypothetical protein [Akkermansiaceae bacterium]